MIRLLFHRFFKLFKLKKDVPTLILNDLHIRIITVEEMEKITGCKSAAFFEEETNTITIAERYYSIKEGETAFVHELIHFFDSNGIKNITMQEVNLINFHTIRSFCFKINSQAFANAYNEVIKIKRSNVPKDFKRKLQKDNYSSKQIFFNLTKEFRADKGLEIYNLPIQWSNY